MLYLTASISEWMGIKLEQRRSILTKIKGTNSSIIDLRLTLFRNDTNKTGLV